MKRQNLEIFFDDTQSPAYKCYASPYDSKIFNSFNPELQLTDTEFAIMKLNRRFND